MTTKNNATHFDSEGWPAAYPAYRDPNMQDSEVQDEVQDEVDDATQNTNKKLTILFEGAD